MIGPPPYAEVYRYAARMHDTECVGRWMCKDDPSTTWPKEWWDVAFGIWFNEHCPCSGQRTMRHGQCVLPWCIVRRDRSYRYP